MWKTNNFFLISLRTSHTLMSIYYAVFVCLQTMLRHQYDTLKIQLYLANYTDVEVMLLNMSLKLMGIAWIFTNVFSGNAQALKRTRQANCLMLIIKPVNQHVGNEWMNKKCILKAYMSCPSRIWTQFGILSLRFLLKKKNRPTKQFTKH